MRKKDKCSSQLFIHSFIGSPIDPTVALWNTESVGWETTQMAISKAQHTKLKSPHVRKSQCIAMNISWLSVYAVWLCNTLRLGHLVGIFLQLQNAPVSSAAWLTAPKEFSMTRRHWGWIPQTVMHATAPEVWNICCVVLHRSDQRPLFVGIGWARACCPQPRLSPQNHTIPLYGMPRYID